MTALPLATLIEDWSIYPRHAVDDAHVTALVSALRAGAALPPILADESSKRITDGWHRLRAQRRVLGPQGVTEVELKPYPDEQAMLLDAIHRNAEHGRRLDRIDQVRAVAMAEGIGASSAMIAKALVLPPERIETLRVRVATAPRAGPETIPGTVQVALKRPLAHLAGTTLTEAQVRASAGAPGTSYLLLAHQLTEGLQANLVDRGDERLVAGLRALAAALAAWLP